MKEVKQKIVSTGEEKYQLRNKVFKTVNSMRKEINLQEITDIPPSHADFSFDMKGKEDAYRMQAFIWDYGYKRELEWNVIGENREIMERGMKIRDEILERMNLKSF